LLGKKKGYVVVVVVSIFGPVQLSTELFEGFGSQAPLCCHFSLILFEPLRSGMFGLLSTGEITHICQCIPGSISDGRVTIQAL